MVMFLVSFFSWWYGAGWSGLIPNSVIRSKKVLEAFSVYQLSQTLFAPWRRIITYPGASLAEKFRAWGDNLFSRIIGFIVRLFVIMVGLIFSLTVFILTWIEIIIWPLAPIAVIGVIIVGVIL
jgi:hypothetical protein